MGGVSLFTCFPTATLEGPALAGPPPVAVQLQGLQRVLSNPWLTANNPPLSGNNGGLFFVRIFTKKVAKIFAYIKIIS